MKKYKVHKGLQKEIRLFRLNKSLAIQFIVSCVFEMGFFIVVTGLSNVTFFLCVAFLFILYAIFKRIDKLNKKHSLKKKKANKRKPSIVKRVPSKIIPINELFN